MVTRSSSNNRSRWYYIRWIANLYRGMGPLVVFLLVLTGLSTMASILLPQLFRSLIDNLTVSLQEFNAGSLRLDEAMQERNRNLWLLLALAFGPVIGAIYPWIRLRMNLYFEQRLRERFLRSTLGRESPFFLRFTTGDLVTRLTDNLKCAPSGLPWLCCSGIFRAFTAIGVIVCCLIGMLLLHPGLALGALVPLPIMLFVFLRLQTTLESRCAAVQEKASETTSFLESAFTGIRILKSFTAETAQQQAFRTLLDRRREHEAAQARTEGLFQIYFEFLTYLGEILVLAGGGILVVNGSLTLGTYYAFFSYLGMILPLVMDIPMLLVTLSQAFVVIDRLEDLERPLETTATDATPLEPSMEPQTTNQDEPIAAGFQTLRFEKVGFAFPAPQGDAENRSFRLGNVSFELRRGEKIAIMGRIGSGKSTLLHLAAGLFDPDRGRILADGIPLSEIARDRWRETVGFVQQEPIVFSGSVRENIDFWRNLEPGRVETATDLARLREEVARLPNGFDEKLGARGTGLSGGQRQRLSLARALAGKPRLLLMDDVTAGLDAANERTLWRKLRKTSRDLTCLIVTHRAATARVADRILVLDRGTVIASGTHAELSRTSPLYRELAGMPTLPEDSRAYPVAA